MAISFSAPVEVDPIHSTHVYAKIAMLTDSLFVLAVRGYTGSVTWQHAIAGEITDGAVSFGSKVALADYPADIDICKSTSSTFCVSYITNSDASYAQAGSVSGTTITLGSSIEVNDAGAYYCSICQLEDNKLITVRKDGSYAWANVLNLSGTTITRGDGYDCMNIGDVGHGIEISAMSSTHAFITSTSNSGLPYTGRSVAVKITGNVISAGYQEAFESSNVTAHVPSIGLTSDKTIVFFTEHASPYTTKLRQIDVNLTSLDQTIGSQETIVTNVSSLGVCSVNTVKVGIIYADSVEEETYFLTGIKGETDFVFTDAIKCFATEYSNVAVGYGGDRYVVVGGDTNDSNTLKLSISSSGAQTYDVCQKSVFFNGKYIIGDFETGKLYDISYDYLTANGTDYERKRTFQVIHGNHERIKHCALTLDFQENSSGLNPACSIKWTDDGGVNWSSPIATTASRFPVMFRRLGVSRSRIYELTITGSSPLGMLGGYIDIGDGSAERGSGV